MDFLENKYIVNEKGKVVGVILGIRKYRAMLNKLEELASILAYDEAKKDQGRILKFDEVVKKIEKKRK